MLYTMFLRCRSPHYLTHAGVFASLSLACAAVREACFRSGTPWHLVENLLKQVREREQEGNTLMSPLTVSFVRVYIPPPLEDSESCPMVLFRGTTSTNVEEWLQHGSGQCVYFSSSLQIALPFGRLEETEKNYRVMICRVERRPGFQLFNKISASDEELKYFDSVDGNLKLFHDAQVRQSSTKDTPNKAQFDGVVDWLDDGVSYCFDADLVRLHTLLCIDVQW